MPRSIPTPSEVRLSLSADSGAQANPLVKVGDAVKVGQVIGAPSLDGASKDGASIHASVSGTVKSIDTINTFTGEKVVTVTIASDGNQTLWEGCCPPHVTSTAEFLEAVKNSGVAELGGSDVPAAQELAGAARGALDYLLINCIESEPYITSNTRTMIDDARYVRDGIALLQKYLSPKNSTICIEDTNPELVEKMKGLDGVEIRLLPPKHPQGQRTVLVYSVTGRIMLAGSAPQDSGCLVIDCAAVAAIAKYIQTGVPLVSRCVTVDGPAVSNPQNVIAPLGTPVRALFDFCGGLKDGVKKITLGGPMTGIAIPSADIPITKTTSAVLAFAGKDAESPEALPCIKCGRCVKACPLRLLPSSIETAFELKKNDRLQKLKANMCIECGCCQYVCPSKRPLAQVMSLSKKILKQAEEKY